MPDFDTAMRTMERAIQTGQIGTPVAARIAAVGTLNDENGQRLQAETLSRLTAWFGSSIGKLTASQSDSRKPAAALVRFAHGQSALVSTGADQVSRPTLLITLWGNKGCLSWKDDHFCGDSLWDNPLSDATSRILQQLNTSRSLQVRHASGTNSGAGDRIHRPLPPPYGVLLVAGDYTHQPAYAEALAADARCRLIGLTDEAGVPDRRRKLNDQFARRLGIPVLPDLQSALHRDDVQIVSLCAEPHRRGPIAVLAARAGKHLYLDKPLAVSLADTDAIVAAVQQSGVVAHMFSLVHGDAAHRVRSLVESGELGDITAVHLDVTFAKGPAGGAVLGQPRVEAFTPDQVELIESKRELTNVGVYAVVQLLTLLKHSIQSVTATTGNYFFREHQQDDLEDFGQMLLEFAGGTIATISAGRTGWRSHPSGGLNRALVIGTRGSALIDADEPCVDIWADVEPWKPPEHNPDDPMGMWATPPGSPFVIAPRQPWLTPLPVGTVNDASDFLDCVEQGRESVVSASVAAAATEVLIAAYRSAATGTSVVLPLPR
ncbi:MAG: Gfo/Idh/MocA family oxidoreductase [Planctomycetaceae bacterium]|nr:Gfo/Idh/MocA family oxidoreductase [Planctomycetaceae bacterium]